MLIRLAALVLLLSSCTFAQNSSEAPESPGAALLRYWRAERYASFASTPTPEKQASTFRERIHAMESGAARLSAHDKFELMLHRTYSLRNTAVPLAMAGISFGRDEYPEWGDDGPAYGKYAGSEFGTAQARNLLHTFVLATAFRQDPRYFDSPDRGKGARLGYAISRVFVTRSDSGKSVFNASQIGAHLATAGLENAWIPDRHRSAEKTFERFGIQLGVQAGVNIAREFIPLFRQALK